MMGRLAPTTGCVVVPAGERPVGPVRLTGQLDGDDALVGHNSDLKVVSRLHRHDCRLERLCCHAPTQLQF